MMRPRGSQWTQCVQETPKPGAASGPETLDRGGGGRAHWVSEERRAMGRVGVGRSSSPATRKGGQKPCCRPRSGHVRPRQPLRSPWSRCLCLTLLGRKGGGQRFFLDLCFSLNSLEITGKGRWRRESDTQHFHPSEPCSAPQSKRSLNCK